MKANQEGFSVVEIVLVLVVVGLIGAAGWFVWQSNNKTSNKSTDTIQSTSTKSETPTPETAKAKNPYEGWLTYKSTLNSGLTFRYPPNWKFTPPKEAFKNNNGGEELDATLISVEPTRDPTPAGATAPSPANNVYMCLSFDEYGGSWSYSNWFAGKRPVSSEQFKVNSTNITLATYKGANSMQSQMVLFTPNHKDGDHFISTKNGYVVSVSAQFNCGQADYKILENMTEDFSQREEVKTAKLIMKSISY